MKHHVSLASNKFKSRLLVKFLSIWITSKTLTLIFKPMKKMLHLRIKAPLFPTRKWEWDFWTRRDQMPSLPVCLYLRQTPPQKQHTTISALAHLLLLLHPRARTPGLPWPVIFNGGEYIFARALALHTEPAALCFFLPIVCCGCFAGNYFRTVRCKVIKGRRTASVHLMKCALRKSK